MPRRGESFGGNCIIWSVRGPVARQCRFHSPLTILSSKVTSVTTVGLCPWREYATDARHARILTCVRRDTQNRPVVIIPQIRIMTLFKFRVRNGWWKWFPRESFGLIGTEWVRCKDRRLYDKGAFMMVLEFMLINEMKSIILYYNFLIKLKKILLLLLHFI